MFSTTRLLISATLLSAVLLIGPNALAVTTAASTDNGRYTERALYLDAKTHLAAGRQQAFKRNLAQLKAYPIAPYLEYYELRRRIDKVSDAEMAGFMQRYSELPIAPLLRQRWLHRLGAKAKWRRFLTHYNNDSNTKLKCFRLRALYATDRKEEAFAGVPELWITGKSLPKACDPIFDLWIKTGAMTPDMVWQRLALALGANQRVLARYLLTLLPDSKQQQGQLFYRANADPKRLLKTKFSEDSPSNRQIVLHAHERLIAKREMEDADTLWQRTSGWDVVAPQRNHHRIKAMLGWAVQGVFPKVSEIPGDLSDADQTLLFSALAQAAVRAQNWAEVVTWIRRLPDQAGTKNQWQYWLARGLSETSENTEQAQLTFTTLAQQRDYYGFLAAQQLGLPPVMNSDLTNRNQENITKLRERPEVERVLELYAVREFVAARREWRLLLPQLDTTQQAAAAHLANDIGWPRQAIEAANVAKLHNDTHLRFPILHMTHYQRMSHATDVPLTLLLAVSRQESAFDDRARSSANARGLMQLLPSTAERVARKAKLVKPTTTSLYRPSTNIEIASHYLANLLDRFGGSRPLAIAGYNAGEHRVDRWLSDASNMPMDVWIERIPYKETRNYVKNVLAFTQVYGHKLARTGPILRKDELHVPLLPQSQITADRAAKASRPSKG